MAHEASTDSRELPGGHQGEGALRGVGTRLWAALTKCLPVAGLDRFRKKSRLAPGVCQARTKLKVLKEMNREELEKPLVAIILGVSFMAQQRMYEAGMIMIKEVGIQKIREMFIEKQAVVSVVRAQAELPRLHDDGSFEVSINQGFNLYPGESILASTGLAVDLPARCSGKWRCSDSCRVTGIEVAEETIRGGKESKVLMRNVSSEDLVVPSGGVCFEMMFEEKVQEKKACGVRLCALRGPGHGSNKAPPPWRRKRGVENGEPEEEFEEQQPSFPSAPTAEEMRTMHSEQEASGTSTTSWSSWCSSG